MQVTNFYTSIVTNLMNNDVNNEYITGQTHKFSGLS
jgi:hypothetical protein